MKHKNLKKAVEKFARVLEKEKNQFRAEFVSQVIEWSCSWYDPESVELLRVRHMNDKDHIVSDYIGGSFYETIKGALAQFTQSKIMEK